MTTPGYSGYQCFRPGYGCMLGATTAHREEAATNVRIGCINVCGYTGLGLANCAVAPARAQFIARYGPSNRLRSKPVR
jgi:hypothetical protein